ncbi:SMI1/KNR4 family protein [Streptomyces sp. NPDC051555]|uniref:Lsr2 family DNA-binding protein n=1 Tax=Streptomyces sp. NPDC051555 TaxID=3365657 RepID=UPI003791BF8A
MPSSAFEAVEALVRLCPPPAAPTPPSATDWAAKEGELGFRLPDDYKRLCDAYGPGSFGDFIGIRHPLGATDWMSLTGPMATIVERQLEVDRAGGTLVPHDPRRLFAVGVTDNGQYLFWVTEPQDAPDRWRIVVHDARGPRWFSFDGGLVAFLAAVLGGRTRVPLFPDGLLDEGVCFTPSPELRPGDEPRIVTVTGTARHGRTLSTDALRVWARANGYELPPRGRIPLRVRTAWERAHPEG